MDKFLYTIKLAEINRESRKSKLIDLMSKLTCRGLNKRPLNLTNLDGRLPRFFNRGKEERIASVYYYSLFVSARHRYIELGYDFANLPKYAQMPPLHIDLEATIKEIKFSDNNS